MRTVRLAGLTVSAQGLGCMGMSEFYGPADRQQCIATVRHALDLGVTLLDTADMYGRGHNEELLAEAIAGRRHEVQIATKFGVDRSAGDNARVMRGEPAYVRSSAEASLRRLGVDVIDLYYLHRPPQNTPIEETVGAMAELVTEGKVRCLGLSEVDGELLRRADAVHPITAVQSEYSLFARDPQTQVAETLRELDVALVPYSPLGRGYLTGMDVRALDPTDLRPAFPRLSGAAEESNRLLVDVVRSVADRRGLAPAQVALAWVHSRAEPLGVPVVPIPGARRPEHVTQNALAADLVLDGEALQELEGLGDRVVGERYPARYPDPASR